MTSNYYTQMDIIISTILKAYCHSLAVAVTSLTVLRLTVTGTGAADALYFPEDKNSPNGFLSVISGSGTSTSTETT